MADEIKYKPVPVSNMPEATNTKGFWIFGSKEDNGVLKSVRFAFDKITSLFGVSQIDGDSITLVPSLKLFTEKTQLATEAANGLMSKEQYNFIENMTTNMQDLVNAVAAIRGYENTYETQAVINYENEQPMKLATAASIRKYTAVNPSYRIQTDCYVTADVSIAENNKDGVCMLGYLLPKSKQLVNIYVNGSDRFSIRDNTLPYTLLVISSNPSFSMVSFIGTKAKGVNLDGVVGLKTIYAQDNYELTEFNFKRNRLLEYSYTHSCTKIKRAEYGSSKLIQINLQGCLLLETISNTENMTSLKLLNITGCAAVKKSSFLSFMAMWNSQVASTAGAVKIAKTLYDQLTEAEKNEITDKNITIQFE